MNYIPWGDHNTHRNFEMKQKYSQVEKAGGKHFNIKELSTNRTAFKSEQVPNEMRAPSNKDCGPLVGLPTQQWGSKCGDQKLLQTKTFCNQQKFWVNTEKHLCRPDREGH